jgi:hypothetical protein
MNSEDVLIFLTDLKNNTENVNDSITIDKVIDMIKSKEVEDDIFGTNCIIDWELYHKYKGGEKIKTDFDFNKPHKIVLNSDEMRDLCEKAALGDLDLTEYLVKMTDSAREGNRSIIFDSMKPEVLMSLEQLGFKVEWFDNSYEKGWLVKW